MPSIIIDGYNVIGVYHGDREKMRERFIDLLIRYKQAKQHDITVVFDGHKSGAGTEHAAVRGGVRIIYSRLGVRADDVIKRIISQDRREWIVVSSDRDIARHAWSVSSIPVPSDTFSAIIERKRGDDATPEAQEAIGKEEEEVPPYVGEKDDGDYVQSSRGNPHRLSKKERAIRKALGKL
ncbi:MAG: NYN domain-containing protein [Nitrospirota bacterium]